MTRLYNPATEWVPIESGQMPELNREVIVTIKKNYDKPYSISGFSSDHPIAEGESFFIDLECDPMDDVIAWRYLPEPYTAPSNDMLDDHGPTIEPLKSMFEDAKKLIKGEE